MSENRITYKISFSEYSAFKQCPHKWYLNNIVRLPSEINEELIFGQIVHKSIESIVTKPMFKKQMFWEGIIKNHLKNEIEQIKDINYLTKFNGSGLAFVFVKQAMDILKELNFYIRFEEYEVIKVEHQLDGIPLVSFDNVDFVFKGFIDLVLRHKKTGRYLVIDWKTSRKKWDITKKMKDNEDFFTQLGLYKHFYSETMNVDKQNIDVKFFNLPREEPKEMAPYHGSLNDTYIEYLVKSIKDVCKEIYEHKPWELRKIKHHSKKNFCHRCNFNVENLCNDVDEYQILSI